jgi:hypothetical protein
MSGWKMWFHDAPVGASSLGAICLTAVCFPAARLLTGWERYVAAALFVICGFTFTPAVTCSFYSIVKEKLKMVGGIGLFIAGVTVWLQRETLYFIEMGIVLVPCTIVVMVVIAKRRATASEATSI